MSPVPGPVSDRAGIRSWADVVDVRPAEPHEVQAALELEYAVFAANGFCAESERLVVAEYEQYRSASVFTVAVAGGEVVGVLREIRPGPHGLPVFTEFEPLAGSLTLHGSPSVSEVGILAIRPDHQGAELAKRLYREAFWQAKRAGITHWGAVVEQWLLDLFVSRFHFTFEACGVPREYMGGICHPVVMGFRDTERAIHRTDRRAYDWFREGYPDADELLAGAATFELQAC